MVLFLARFSAVEEKGQKNPPSGCARDAREQNLGRAEAYPARRVSAGHMRDGVGGWRYGEKVCGARAERAGQGSEGRYAPCGKG